ncbi:TetR family transcriptional regulator [Granulicella sp. WH15]|uniref:TetR/AcrR family transcriptional regulator n=1 Tax=Granulicella sp. WH15 TaxID=2602070 RepID=UPI0013671D4F|nr:TetR family transcriptional regulator [Granulicella sp. WH15]QHN03656.1 TetR family transcriptional regulator [Granulicella sp. WH15]
MATKKDGLRERKKLALRHLLTNTTIDLFLEHGFQGTSVDRISEVAGVSRRTFFYYFPAKQDVVTAWYAQQGEYLAAAFNRRPHGETPWESLTAAFLEMHKHYGGNEERTRRLRQLIHLEPALLAKKYDFYLSAAEMLVPAVKTRVRAPNKQNLLIHVIVQAAIAAYNAAYGEWIIRPRSRFESIALSSFKLARPVSAGDLDLIHENSCP